MANSILQSTILPDEMLCDEPSLFFRLSNGAAFADDGTHITFASGSQATSNTYFNLFNIGKWTRHTDLEDLSLEIRGEGRFNVSVFLQGESFAVHEIAKREIELSPTTATVLELPVSIFTYHKAVLYFALTCQSETGRLDRADWSTRTAPARQVKLALAITTFRREAAVASTVERFKEHLLVSAYKDQIELIVVDNGRTAEISETDQVMVFRNENLGGAGGFARGLLEAKARGASHCLFMDDDASVFMGAIDRTVAFLSYDRSGNIAIAGAMSHSDDSFRIWENGARFHQICRPIAMGTDLRLHTDLVKIELKSTEPNASDFYGGWWFFAFPIDRVHHMPFPFFVRGDDVSFSLVHEFESVTLPGVMSFQDDDFTAKETPLTVYLDIRSHLAHHLALAQKDIGRLGIVKIIARFWLRSLLNFHYETVEAAALGAQDALSGPSYFDANTDVAARREEIAAFTQNERWRPIPDISPSNAKSKVSLSEDSAFVRILMKITLNGHLLPAFKRFGEERILPSYLRSARRPIWGAKKLSYITADGQKGYSVEINAPKAARVSWLCFVQMWHALIHYGDIKKKWSEGYEEMTTEAYWQQKLGLTSSSGSHMSEGVRISD